MKEQGKLGQAVEGVVEGRGVRFTFTTSASASGSKVGGLRAGFLVTGNHSTSSLGERVLASSSSSLSLSLSSPALPLDATAAATLGGPGAALEPAAGASSEGRPGPEPGPGSRLDGLVALLDTGTGAGVSVLFLLPRDGATNAAGFVLEVLDAASAAVGVPTAGVGAGAGGSTEPDLSPTSTDLPALARLRWGPGSRQPAGESTLTSCTAGPAATAATNAMTATGKYHGGRSKRNTTSMALRGAPLSAARVTSHAHGSGRHGAAAASESSECADRLGLCDARGWAGAESLKCNVHVVWYGAEQQLAAAVHVRTDRNDV